MVSAGDDATAPDDAAVYCYTRLAAVTPLSSPIQRHDIPTTDLYGNHTTVRLKGKLLPALLIVAMLGLFGFIVYFFAPRKIIVDIANVSIQPFMFDRESFSIQSRVVAKLTVSNPNFSRLVVHSVTMVFVYMCGSCKPRDGLALGAYTIKSQQSFEPRTDSETLPWATDFSAEFTHDRYWDFYTGVLKNCSRDLVYFVDVTGSAEVSSTMMPQTSVPLAMLKARIPCHKPNTLMR